MSEKQRDNGGIAFWPTRVFSPKTAAQLWIWAENERFWNDSEAVFAKAEAKVGRSMKKATPIVPFPRIVKMAGTLSRSAKIQRLMTIFSHEK